MSVVNDVSKIVLRSPGAFAAAVPALVGFYPSDSLVAVFLGEGRVIVTMRLDLPEDLEEAAEYVAATGTRLGADEVVLVVCCARGAGDLPHHAGVGAVIDALEDAGIAVKDAMLIDSGRYWSYLCQSVECCPPEGTLIPEDAALEAEKVGLGQLAVAESRDAVVQQYAPRIDLAPSPETREQAQSILDVTLAERAKQCWDEVRMLAATPVPADPSTDLMRSRLQVAMADVRVRDFVMAKVALSEDDVDALVDVVVQAALTAPEDLRPRVAGAASALLAACGTSSIAVSCLLELADGESLAELVRMSQSVPVPPEVLREVFTQALPMVEDQLRASTEVSTTE